MKEKRSSEKARIAEAVGVSAAAEHDSSLAQRLEDAMAQAVRHAMADGVSLSDTETMRQRMAEARQRVLDEAGR